VIPGRWSRDGLHLLYAWDDSARSGNIDILSVAGDSVTSRPYLHESWTEWDPDLSPDGRCVAYASNEAGNFEVFVRGLPIPGAKYQVSQGGGITPRWGPDGHTLYYLNRYSGTGGNGMPMAAEIDGRTDFRVLSRRSLGGLAKYRIGGFSSEDYDIHPNGKTFVVLRIEDTAIGGMTVVLNWFEELKARMGVTP